MRWGWRWVALTVWERPPLLTSQQVSKKVQANGHTDMTAFYTLSFCLLLSTVAREMSIKEISLQRRSRATANSYVVSQQFCESSLAGEGRIGHKTLEEVHTYSELKHDPRASLPDSFTVCSTIMTRPERYFFQGYERYVHDIGPYRRYVHDIRYFWRAPFSGKKSSKVDLNIR